MKTITIALLSAFLINAAPASKAITGAKSTRDTNVNAKGYAVIELFTSEGCSSCPPADELVAKIQKETNGQPVYILAFHVDYWNHLGWKDVFSNADYSKRQRQYASWLNLQSVYTPQIVVNGKMEFVGSEEGTLRNAIKSSLQKTPSVQLTINDVKITQGQVNMQYHTAGAVGKNTALVLSIVQKSAQSKVQSGENAGHTLSHVQIVRKLQSMPLNSNNNGTANILLPPNQNIHNLVLVAFLQKQSNGEIISAAKFDLN